MARKILLSSVLVFVGSGALTAQTAAALYVEPHKAMDMEHTIRQLEQNALIALIAGVLLMGAGWMVSVWKACTQLNQSTGSAKKQASALLILITGLSIFCGSCTAAQRARVEQYRIAQEAERRACPLRYHYQNTSSIPFFNHNPNTSYTKLAGPTFCRYCGRRIQNNP